MAELGTYQIPKEFRDEDKWFKFFNRKQLAITGGGILLCVPPSFIFHQLGYLQIGLAIDEIIILAALLLAFLPLPTERFLVGGGFMLNQIVLRLIIKNLPKNKKLYVKNYEEED